MIDFKGTGNIKAINNKHVDLNKYISTERTGNNYKNKSKKSKSNRIMWAIIPYSKNMKTNIIKEFKRIIINCLDNNPKLNKIIDSASIIHVNKGNLNRFYVNISNINQNPNNNGNNTYYQNNNNCNCRDFSSCYVKDNRYQESSVVYRDTVETHGKTFYYLGATANKL